MKLTETVNSLSAILRRGRPSTDVTTAVSDIRCSERTRGHIELAASANSIAKSSAEQKRACSSRSLIALGIQPPRGLETRVAV